MTLADKLTDGACADIWTDAHECAEQVQETKNAMEEAAKRLRSLEEAAMAALTQLRDLENGYSHRELHEPLPKTIAALSTVLDGGDPYA